MSTEPTSLRLDSDAKKQAYAIFEQVGLKPTQAINLFLKQVALRGGIPFDIKVPNADTLVAMDELENGKGARFKSKDELFEDLGI
ncbi:MAG: type II toxin-antitoxin system RelB/DinJ family antitoxin [Alphaproteobacteria bacterium]|tara:strand:+ start:1021 stop:1275 length:255 start_codon:yes stop_codon:yes gene_type:complete